MLTDFVDKQDFYQGRLGRKTQDILRAQTNKIWPNNSPGLSAERILPLGCGALLLGALPVVSARMTEAQGETFSCLVDSQNKPLPDGAIDRVLTLHAFETSCEIEPLLHEIWRVLKGEGRLLMILPKKHGAWEDDPGTPFGREPAFSPSQIKNILRHQGFLVERVCRGLYASPKGLDCDNSLAHKIEKHAPGLFLTFGGGVLFIEARKRVYGLAGIKGRKQQRCADPLFPLPLPI
jgi:SAM-dependent methyltransferase